MNDFRTQLAPGWTGVNIAILVVAFLMWWPLALLMLLYIVFGEQLNIHLAKPDTLRAFGRRILQAWQAATASWRSTAPAKHFNSVESGTPNADHLDT